MRKLSRYLILTYLALLIFTMPVMAEDSSIKVFVNGKVLDDVVPIVKDRTLVPIRFISEELGFDVEYIEKSGTVNIKKNDRKIEITMDSDKAKVDNIEVELDVKPFIKENRMFVPLRFISEGLGEKVIWDGRNQIVLVGEFKDETIIKDTFLYFNNEYNYTLNFPDSWEEEAIIETKEGTLYVYDKKSAERFIEDGYESFGPVFEIRCSDYPVTASFPYEGDYVLNYNVSVKSNPHFNPSFSMR